MNQVLSMEPLVTSEWLAECPADSNMRVVEVDVSPTAYNAGHIPGALLWNVYKDLLQPNYRIVEQDAFAQLLSKSEIAPETRVVVCGYAAAFAFWMMAHYGHHPVSYLNGARTK